MTSRGVFPTLLPMIAIVDYGIGNLGSVRKGCLKMGLDARIVTDAQSVKDAAGVIVPGVGAMGAAMKNLREMKLVDVIKNQIAAGKPFLGICLGYQMLFSYSEEAGGVDCLDVFKGRIVRFPKDVVVPHMGWNQVCFRNRGLVGDEIPDGSFFYFVHSYYVVPEDESLVMTTTEYGREFASSILKDNVAATQFHPEKSQKMGLKMLELFGKQVNES